MIPTAASGSIGRDWYAERNAHNLFHGKVHLLARGLIAGGGQRCGEGASHGRWSDARDAGPSLLSIACEGQLGSLPSGAAGRDRSWISHRLTCSGLSVLCVLASAHLFTDSDALVSFPPNPWDVFTLCVLELEIPGSEERLLHTETASYRLARSASGGNVRSIQREGRDLAKDLPGLR